MKNISESFEKNVSDFSEPALRFDGLYKHNNGYGYLRFYPSGLVLDVSSTGTPEQVARWFNESHDAVSKGTYVCNGNRLSFSVVIDQVRGKNRNCSYEGEITDDGRLILNWYSEVTKRSDIYCYDFYPFEKESILQKIRFDGVYQRMDDTYSSYLRFYPNGRVITVSSTGTPQQIAGWFNENHSTVTRGEYAIEGMKIAFSVSFKTASGNIGVIDYHGDILNNGSLMLNWYSNVTNKNFSGSYKFVPISSMAPNIEITKTVVKTVAKSPVRFDGLYEHKCSDYSGYFRFYPSGLVLDVSSTGTPEQVARWFNESYKDAARGKYTTNGKKISFTVTFDAGGGRTGITHYDGEFLSDGRLKVSWSSELNGNSGVDIHDFVRVSF